MSDHEQPDRDCPSYEREIKTLKAKLEAYKHAKGSGIGHLHTVYETKAQLEAVKAAIQEVYDSVDERDEPSVFFWMRFVESKLEGKKCQC